MNCPKCNSENTTQNTPDSLNNKFSPLIGLHICLDCGKLFDEDDIEIHQIEYVDEEIKKLTNEEIESMTPVEFTRRIVKFIRAGKTIYAKELSKGYMSKRNIKIIKG